MSTSEQDLHHRCMWCGFTGDWYQMRAHLKPNVCPNYPVPCAACGGTGKVKPAPNPTPAAPAQPEPRTPDETLAALTREWRAAVGDDPDDDIDVDRAVAAGDALVKRLRELAGRVERAEVTSGNAEYLIRQLIDALEAEAGNAYFETTPPLLAEARAWLAQQQPTEGTDA